MGFKLTVAAFFLTAVIGQAAQAVASPTHLHWSEQQTVRPPSGNVKVIVSPSKNLNGAASVYAIVNGARPIILFRLERDGMLSWNPNGSRIAITDQISSNRNVLRLFTFGDLNGSGVQSGDHLDNRLRSAASADLPRASELQYYFPRVENWLSNSRLRVSVGILYTFGATGSFKSKCMTFTIDTLHGYRIRRIRAADTPDKKRVHCQLWP